MHLATDSALLRLLSPAFALHWPLVQERMYAACVPNEGDLYLAGVQAGILKAAVT